MLLQLLLVLVPRLPAEARYGTLLQAERRENKSVLARVKAVLTDQSERYEYTRAENLMDIDSRSCRSRESLVIYLAL